MELSNSRPLSLVLLYGLNGEAELSGHLGKEVEEGGKGLRLGAQRESPRVMGKIINNDQIRRGTVKAVDEEAEGEATEAGSLSGTTIRDTLIGVLRSL